MDGLELLQRAVEMGVETLDCDDFGAWQHRNGCGIH